MSGLLKKVVALGAAVMMTMSPVLAKELGVYQTTDRKMDFLLTTCGGGADLCVTLTAARGSAATDQVVPFIGKLVVTEAKPAGENMWRGNFRYGEYDLGGTLKLRPGHSFVISGCVYLVICSDINLIPAR